mgnify:CR=1 FL=1
MCMQISAFLNFSRGKQGKNITINGNIPVSQKECKDWGVGFQRYSIQKKF